MIIAGAAMILIPPTVNIAFGENLRVLDDGTRVLYMVHAVMCCILGIRMLILGARKE